MTAKPPAMSGLLVLLGAISVLGPLSIDMYLPALPAIGRDLHAGAGAVQLTLPAFFIGLAVSQLLFGSLADHFGRRPPMLAGLAVIAVGSVGCALTGDVGALTFWRVVQSVGVGSAVVIPRAVVRDRFDIVHTARAMSLLGLITGLGPILAPQIGGLLLRVANWRAIFWLLCVLAGLCFAITYATLRESRPQFRSVAIGPALWLSLLTDRHFVRYSLPANLIQASVFAYLSGSPFVFIGLLGLTPQQFALAFGANAVGLMIAGRINAHLVLRMPPERIFRRATVVTAALGTVLAAVAWFGQGGLWALAVPLFFFISSLAFIFSNGFALTLAPYGESAGTASALHGTLQFTFAFCAGAAVSALYDNSARAMCGVICALTVGGATLYRYLAGDR